MINVLHVISSVSAGGIESFVVALYNNIDRENFHFDFAVFNPNDPIHEEELKDMGANVYFISDAGCNTTKLSKIMWRLKAIHNYNKLLKKNKYDVVHCHNYQSFSLYVLLARLHGVKKTVVHSHNAGGVNETKWTYIKRRIKKTLGFEWLITDKIGCSNWASDWLYGEGSVKRGKAKTFYNGVDMDKFSRSSYPDASVTKAKYGLDDRIQFINVGRFSVQKNQEFLILAFEKIKEKMPNVHLNMIGFGELEGKLKKMVVDKKLEGYVTFYPSNTNVPELLSACDFFILPSLWEGLPIVAIEAQSMKVPMYISDKVTDEVNMGMAKYLSVESPELWADEIVNDINNDTYPKTLDLERVKLFDMKNVAHNFERLYSSKRN